MYFPKFWARGEHQGFFAWRWSDRSVDDALQQATETAKRIYERFSTGSLERQSYGYADRPLREEQLEMLAGAVVTRNAVGCEVLNTERAAFIDIDLPQLKKPGFVARLFGAKAPAEDSAISGTREKLESWLRLNPRWGVRLYRTKGGLRILVTHDLIEPESGEILEAFKKLGADPLYQKLCTVQKSFRARLTPKPYRCGCRSAPARWPWLSAEAEREFRRWETEYQKAGREFSTCKFIEVLGSSRVHPEIQPIVELHDERTGALKDRPLA